MTKRIALYVRVSTDKNQTVENQLRELQQVAVRMGWTVVGVFTDEGVSGGPRAATAVRVLTRS